VNAIPDPAQFVYQPAVRKQVGLMIMLAGASGTGKTLSALRLAVGLAGPDGRIAFCDTENDRALYYADRFTFRHLSLSEPFRPGKFEAAAVAAQQQKAVVFIVDSFSHEHVGPGGVLDFHEEELSRMVARQQQNDERYHREFSEAEARDRMKAAAWIAPKGEHKHMLQRLWQLNTHIILCCQAEKKLALIKNDKGKTDWIDQGFQPICGSDIPYAMTLSFMLNVEKPGVPIVIKPLLESLQPLIPLDRPMDEQLGARLAAWSRGGEILPSPSPVPPQVQSSRTSDGGPAAGERREGARPVRSGDPSRTTKRQPTEEEIEAGVARLEAAFLGTDDRKAHLALVDVEANRKQIEWLKKHRPVLHKRVDAALRSSWARVGKQQSLQLPPSTGHQNNAETQGEPQWQDEAAELIAEIMEMDRPAIEDLTNNKTWQAKMRDLFPPDQDRVSEAITERTAYLRRQDP
jgi:hypothetical protein